MGGRFPNLASFVQKTDLAEGPAAPSGSRLNQVYTARIQDLEMLASIGQGLITAVTLPAALGAPLLLIGTERHAASAPLCSRYLVTLARPLRHAFRMVYRPIERAGGGDFIASLVEQD